ncbi:Di-copper centre-containing protein [Dothidotthia symphoricarpi CBS 119687]|uniref:Di-copper centre-containing protein n=1 Tax=Dothidotthia symphoricarpi CBS 119687 TaxID=1392245 RepID=A0A6A6A423_9PLEO|nr:Di-copper centre-containing protein [Dothidotthia symphoricarpi CBS 119687]KAF2126639.1 Di-copper centre-containing protein [Dothidotthia symphoricarpi CBS 119687]
MRFSGVAAAALIGSAGATFKFMEHDQLAAIGVVNLGLDVAQNGYPNEKSRLTKSEKFNYIDAVKCLHQKPALTPAAIASGAKSRYDDFVVTHVLQTNWVHGNFNFLSWHRYYIWAYEQLLRNECGYKGHLPYYNWAWWSDDPAKSPLFDGSETSMSDGGAFVPGKNFTCVPNEARCNIKLAPGSGGGCVSGPLANWTVNIGPIQTKAKGIKPNPQADGLGWNPRCLSRDLNKQAAFACRDEIVTALIRDNKDVLSFQNRMQGDFPAGYQGVHSGGHYTIGGDTGSDFYNSPADPAFFFHHAMIDRVWWIWQNQDLKNRRNAIAGTMTFLNIPPTRNGTLEDTLSLGSMLEDAFPNITVADAMTTLGGPFCYIYA